MPLPIWPRLLLHDIRAAASRTFWTAGRSNPIKIAMIAITTSSSISVNPWRVRGPENGRMRHLDPEKDDLEQNKPGNRGNPEALDTSKSLKRLLITRSPRSVKKKV